MIHPSTSTMMLYKYMDVFSILNEYDVPQVHHICYWYTHNPHRYNMSYILYKISLKFRIFIFIIFICWLWLDMEIQSNYNYHFSKKIMSKSNKHISQWEHYVLTHSTQRLFIWYIVNTREWIMKWTQIVIYH